MTEPLDPPEDDNSGQDESALWDLGWDDANAAIDAERETHPLIFNETTLPP